MFKHWKLQLLFFVIGFSAAYFLFHYELVRENSDTSQSREEAMAMDTKELQEAINNTPDGGTLNLAPGVYELEKNDNHKSISEYGDSYYALKITKPITITMDKVVFVINTDEEYGAFWIDHTTDVHLKGGVLRGSKLPENVSLISSIAVFVQNSRNVTVENMSTNNFSQGIHLYHSSYNLVRNITTENNLGSGILSFASDNNIIDSCKIRNSSDGHLSLYNGRNNHVLNCIVTEDREGEMGEQGITLESEHHSKVESSMVSGFYYGIDVKNGSEDNIIESNNAFNNQYNINVRPGDAGGNLQTPSHRIHIINNLAVNPRENSDFGIYIGIGEGHIVTGNTLNPYQLIINNPGMQEKFIDKNFYVE